MDRHRLDLADVGPDPLVQVQAWLDDAVAAGIIEPNAMTLATVGASGRPAARMVLLKEVRPDGLVFYTNRTSAKGRDLAGNPWAALVLHWRELGRQVRATGPVVIVDDTASDAYFATRPRGSQLSAWASHQSRVVPDRAALEGRLADRERRFAGAAVPRPPFWGGYRVAPEEVELWQGRPDRLHDRIRYRTGPAGWTLERLEP
ncbi:MAG: pyridoxamine 5'-phosphate oxidase [Acidimicrobiales bacterium]